jgi:hypothetical protein
MASSRSHQLAPSDEFGDDSGRGSRDALNTARTAEDLPYRVELWDDAAEVVEQLIAVAANASIGYAAFYAAAREFPDRSITLRVAGRILSRWSQEKH